MEKKEKEKKRIKKKKEKRKKKEKKKKRKEGRKDRVEKSTFAGVDFVFILFKCITEGAD